MPADDELRALCRRVVIRTMQHKDWQLLSEEEYVRRVYAKAYSQRAKAEAVLTRIADNVYALELHGACQPRQAGSDDARYNRGVHELYQYLWKHARYKRVGKPEDREDAVQTALADVLRALENGEVNEPGAFLKFALFKLLGSGTSISRADKIGPQPPESWEELTETSGAEDSAAASDREPALQDGPLAPTFTPPEEAVEQRQLIEAIDRELRRKFTLHPRATLQLSAAILRLASGLGAVEIADRLGVRAASVSTLILHGKKKLHQNRELRELYVQWFSRRMS